MCKQACCGNRVEKFMCKLGLAVITYVTTVETGAADTILPTLLLRHSFSLGIIQH